MPLHIDRRPATLDAVIGNEGVKDSIRSVFSREDRPHSVLFVGPSGCGKTTLARIVATMIGCSPDDVLEYNSANTRGIDTIREISQNCLYSPMSGKYKVYILDEVHMITGAAANALLKVLEDTPKHVFFLLCTTDPDKLIKAIRTRCMTFEVKSLAAPQLTKLIEQTLSAEGIEDFPKSVVKAIVKAADGCARQAMILLDSVIDIIDEDDALRAVSEATATETNTSELCRLLLETRKNKWDDARFLLKALPDDPEKIRLSILGYMDAVLMSDNCRNPDAIDQIISCFREPYFAGGGKTCLHSDVFSACKVVM